MYAPLWYRRMYIDFIVSKKKSPFPWLELCCKDVKCRNYRGTLAVTKKGHTCQDWDKDNVNKNPNNDPDS